MIKDKVDHLKNFVGDVDTIPGKSMELNRGEIQTRYDVGDEGLVDLCKSVARELALDLTFNAGNPVFTVPEDKETFENRKRKQARLNKKRIRVGDQK